MLAIYGIENVKTGKIYVGSAKDLAKRWYVHKYTLNKGMHHCHHLQYSWNKYGSDAFRLVTLLKIPKSMSEKIGEDIGRFLIVCEQIYLDIAVEAEVEYNSSPTAGNNTGTKFSKLGCKNISKAVAKHYKYRKNRKRQSEMGKKKWKDPVYRKMMCKAAKERHKKNPNLIKEMRSKRKDYSMMSYVRSFVDPKGISERAKLRLKKAA